MKRSTRLIDRNVLSAYFVLMGLVSGLVNKLQCFCSINYARLVGWGLLKGFIRSSHNCIPPLINPGDLIKYALVEPRIEENTHPATYQFTFSEMIVNLVPAICQILVPRLNRIMCVVEHTNRLLNLSPSYP
ncbi:hypothetical protein Pdw03_3738 [Penicillium digitatum]|uniref:Uncharacterized protein n=1 Tax=Penicillium digitatum TaxID=36651 RepID=A0A7T6XGU8_PENDI|nr:hypothetical protein Pdw03_3738 [Penicillium digitatum]